MPVSLDRVRPLLKEQARIELQRRKAKKHPADLLDHVECIDNTTGEAFTFQLIRESDPWYWQRDLLNEWMKTPAHINLKARQDIPIGHKVALKDMSTGDTVLKYGIDMGKVVAPIKQGEHAHVHNIKTIRW